MKVKLSTTPRTIAICITLCTILHAGAQSKDTICDDTCKSEADIATVSETGQPLYSVVAPTGRQIVPPTIDKINEFLKYTDMKADEAVGVIPIAHRNTLVWHVAVNGVMAGCKPEFMPLLIAFSKAMSNPDFRRSLSSTHGWTPYCWLNGPVARQLGFDCGQGEISEPNNAAIGRFINLSMMNLGGYYIKQDRMGTFGYLMPWCMTEDESACIRIG